MANCRSAQQDSDVLAIPAPDETHRRRIVPHGVKAATALPHLARGCYRATTSLQLYAPGSHWSMVNNKSPSQVILVVAVSTDHYNMWINILPCERHRSATDKKHRSCQLGHSSALYLHHLVRTSCTSSRITVEEVQGRYRLAGCPPSNIWEVH